MARIKEVFSTKDEVAHVWARQDQNSGRQAGSIQRLWFDGPTIFSYGRHFPIATFHQKKGKEKIVLFTSQSRSSTTAAHKWAVRGAVSHFQIIKCYDPQEAAQGHHETNLKHWEKVAENIAVNLAKAKKPEKYLSGIAAARREMETYAAYFKCGIKKYKFRFLFIESQDAGKKYTAKQRAEKAAADKIAKEKRAKWEAEEAKREADRIALAVKEFHEGEIDYVRGGEYTYLRFQEGKIETSKGIKMEPEEARAYFDRLKSLQFRFKSQGHLSTNDQGSQFHGFALRNVTADYFEIGCHKIQYSELDNLAKDAGFQKEISTWEGFNNA